MIQLGFEEYSREKNESYEVTNIDEKSTQYKWLQSSLSSAAQKWKIVVINAPMYSTGAKGPANEAAARFVPLFEKYPTLDALCAAPVEDIEEMNEFKLFEEVVQYNITMCGYGPVMTTISLSKRCEKATSEILAYGTSGDVTGDFTSVVGYASGIFK